MRGSERPAEGRTSANDGYERSYSSRMKDFDRLSEIRPKFFEPLKGNRRVHFRNRHFYNNERGPSYRELHTNLQGIR